ncbi:MAG: efflux RND transporter periplasmic adaptor subunit [Deltaproteobacteria bacterium]|nr:efflux RND transporter periplasmic adaptor subunit [Deltaproteobacteria bacterium]
MEKVRHLLLPVLFLLVSLPTAWGQTEHNHGQIFTCPMHPNIRQNEPGSCPICGMDLVPLKNSDPEAGKNEESIMISQATRRLAGIETEKLSEAPAFQKIRAVGSIDYDEGRISTIAAYVDGRIEKLYANYTGVRVKKGEHLAEFYSPALYSAQVEYLQVGNALWKMRDSQQKNALSIQKNLLINAEKKLQELGMSKAQIRELKKNRQARSRLVLAATVSGTVIEKNVIEGSYVKAGQIICKVANLSTVWLLLDMFPEETSFLKFGLKVRASIRSAPGQEFEGRISFISPVISKQTRTVRVRVEIPNPQGILKPGDLADASILLPVGSKGIHSKIYDPELAGQYISPMHPQESSDKPGQCPVCGMDLIPAETFGYTADQNDLEKVVTVPRDAILSLGADHVVFVEREKDRFSLQKVMKGPVVEGNRVLILSGLHAGNTIATKAVFLIDSQMQLSGKTSLMQISHGKKESAQKKHTD